MAPEAKILPHEKSPSERIPPLIDGDRLSRPEFERRYQAMPQLKKAELIDGIVYVPSPARHDQHGRQHSQVATWIGNYCAATPGVDTGCESTVRMDRVNEPQPDTFARLHAEFGGKSRIDQDGYLEGSPELMVEVTASSASYDLKAKKEAYEKNGVSEYVAWRVLDGKLDWFILQKGRYEKMAPDPDGLYRSKVFPGLWLDPAALLRGDMKGVLEALDRGLKSPEHNAFVARLSKG